MPVPIGYQFLKEKTAVIKIPVYNISDFPGSSSVRVKLPNGQIGCYKLKTPDINTPLRVMTKLGVQGVDLVAATGNVNIVISSVIKKGNTATIVENTAEYVRVTSQANADGILFSLANIAPNTSYTFVSDIEIVNTVDDVLSIRIYNKTQAKYINSNVAGSTVTKGAKQRLTGTFNTGALMVAGDVIELWIVQSWQNNTADAFEFKVYKDNLSIN
ncbi:hypothetical protein COJ01_11890 [Priestia megaterium]|uniref:hypothetical protein n=1 Tax=Priestia megaterium TaxID=1404 RepID=UPI000BF88FF4|nr:hypothetical protein [Priestia megaterium]PFL01156.1 hypothetical protein COJ01_11890 [Priestia megaterium]